MSGLAPCSISRSGGNQSRHDSNWGRPSLNGPPAVAPTFVGSMLNGEERTLEIEVDHSEPRVLLAVEGTDSIGGRHQFCFLRRLSGPGVYENDVQMSHPSDFLPLWRRAIMKTYQWRARLRLRRTKKAL